MDMNAAAPVLPVVAMLILSAFVRAVLGFGNALIAMPLLALIVSVQVATPLVALVNATTSVVILVQSWRSIDVKASWRLILSSLIGIPLGLFFLKTAHQSLVEVALGVLLIAFGLYELFVSTLPNLRGEKLAFPFGLIAGVLGGAYNTSGPPIVIYGTLRGWLPESFRATLQCYFLITGLLILAGHGLAGLWTPTVLWIFALSLPGIVLATYLGSKLNKLIARDLFNRFVYVFLILMGVLLVARA
jgi:uncharacterized membrane protein YfcA